MLQPKNIFAKKYRLKRLVDSSGLAEVWEAILIHSRTPNVVALKIFPKLHTAGLHSLEQGYVALSQLQHNNLLPATHLGIYENQPYLEMKYCNNGSAGNKIDLFNEHELVKCFCQTAAALAHLHKNSIIHKSIKPNNILIDGDTYYCYYADLSFNDRLRQTVEKFMDVNPNDINRPVNSSVYINKARTSPACYHAPELFKTEPQASTFTDIWALGASIFHIATGKLPFGFQGGEAQAKGLVMKDLPVDFPEKASLIIKKCLSKNEEDRPTAQEIVEYLKDDSIISNNEANDHIYVQSPNISIEAAQFNKPDNLKTNKRIELKKFAFAFVISLVIVTSCLFIYYNWSSNKNNYVIQKVPSQALKFDTSNKAMESTIVNNSIIEKKLPILKNKTIDSSTSLINKNELNQTKLNQPVILNKSKQITHINITTKRSKANKFLDPGIPKHRDKEQKAQ